MPAMGLMSRLGLSWGAGITAASAVWRKQALDSYPSPALVTDRSSNYGLWDHRRARYELFWALYSNTAYDSIHAWAKQLKSDYGLYRHTRGVYNPSYRIGEFWAAHLMGGNLDPQAGDGKAVPSALPIEAASDAIRAPIARLWRDSTWQVNKTVLSRLGAVTGDGFLKICDDEDRGRVIMEVKHPASFPWVLKDSRGNVRGYRMDERRPNPRFDPLRPSDYDNRQYCTYVEYCLRTETGVRFVTYRDGQPYNWETGGTDNEYEADYPFVPLVHIQHIKVDPDESFGVSELQAGFAKFNEVNDLGSKLHDQVRKIVEGAWHLAGMTPPRDGSNPFASARPGTRDNPEPDRQDIYVLYGAMGSTATPLIFPLPIQETSQEIQNQNKDIELDYAELNHLRTTVSGDASGEARREARKPAEAKVHERRGAYDDGLVRAIQMAIAIGGQRGYDGYEGYDYDSYANNELDFRIGARPVFSVDVMDDLNRQNLLWQTAGMAKAANYPLRLFLKDQGETEEQIALYDRELKREVDQGIDQQGRLAEAQSEAQSKAQLKLVGARAAAAPPAAAPPVAGEPG